MTDPDVKRLLGKAFGEEPPLGIDRDEVLSRGRKRLRTRRLLEAGGVVAAVVVAAVGAVTLTGLVDEPEDLSPAATSTAEQPAPPGPTLPLTPPETTTTHGNPPSSAPSSTPVVPASPRSAQILTDVLLNTRLPGMEGASWYPFPGRDKAEFTVVGGNYVFEADVNTPRGVGALFVSVGPARPDGTPGCDSLPELKPHCEVKTVSGELVSVGEWWDKATGEKRFLAYTVRSDGTTVSVVATNLPEKQRTNGQQPQTSPPASRDTVAQLAVLPGLKYG